MSAIMENFGIFGVMALFIFVAMLAIALHGLVQSLTKGPGQNTGRRRADQGEQPDLFGRAQQYEAIFLEAAPGESYGFQQLAQLVEQMEVEAKFGSSGIYSAKGDEKTMFYIANGMGDGRLDIKSQQTGRLAFIVPLERVGSPTASFDLMTQAAVTVMRTFGGTLKDGSRQTLGGQAVAHLRERISEWEMARRRGGIAGRAG